MSDETQVTDPDLAGLEAARALAHPSRQAIRGALEAAPAGLSAPELARCVGLKHNVVRKHLRLMQAGGLVEVVAARPSGRGRPAVRFRLARSAREVQRCSIEGFDQVACSSPVLVLAKKRGSNRPLNR